MKEYENYSRIYTKTYQNVSIEKTLTGFIIKQIERTKPLSSLEFTENAYSNDNAKKNLISLFESAPFDYSKPTSLIKFLTFFSTNSDDIILDFFSGSATTAHAVMQLNAEDGGNRKFIMVQIPELTAEDSEANRAGFKTLCEIGKERIRRAGKKIKDESPVTTTNLDTGFKVFKLDTSNLKKWNNSYTRDYEEIAMLIKGHCQYLTPNRNPLDMVYEIMLKHSLPLTLPVTEVSALNAAAHLHLLSRDWTKLRGEMVEILCINKYLSRGLKTC